MNKTRVISIASLIGFIDASYLSIVHYLGESPACAILKGCEVVTTSKYSLIFGVPVAVLGVLYYASIFVLILYIIEKAKPFAVKMLLVMTWFGLSASIYFVYLQIFVLKAICLYCMLSVITSIVLWFFCHFIFKDFLYKIIVKPILFKFDPEYIHDRVVILGSLMGRMFFAKKCASLLFSFQDKILEQDVLGIRFANPIGLSAGFDKNAELSDILPSIGFGFAEVGSITGNRCKGNPKPRLWRLPKSKGLMVHYGLKNNGCEEIAFRLKDKKFEIPIGMSVAMTNCQENIDIENAVKDYVKAFETLEPLASYITVNISCPNTIGGQPFVNPENLEKLLISIDRIVTHKSIFIKLSPDISERELDGTLEVLKKHRVHGIICTNLTKKRNNPNVLDANVPSRGGMSGKILEGLTYDMLSYIYKKEGERFVLIGSGGVFNAEDAYKKIRQGATLVQMLTGLIFEGPGVVGQINKELSVFLKRDGFKNIKEAIGVDNKKF